MAHKATGNSVSPRSPIRAAMPSETETEREENRERRRRDVSEWEGALIALTNLRTQ